MEYTQLESNSLWPPALQPKDSRAVPAGMNFAATGTTNTMDQLSQQLLNVLQANVNSNSKPLKKPGTCWTCGEPDHTSRNCPKNKSKGRMQEDSDCKGTKKKSWKRIPPKAVESETIEKGLHTFHWCAKCKSWSTTHSTAGHTGGKKPSSKPTNEPSTNILANAGAWYCAAAEDASSKPDCYLCAISNDLCCSCALKAILKPSINFCKMTPSDTLLTAVSVSNSYLGLISKFFNQLAEKSHSCLTWYLVLSYFFLVLRFMPAASQFNFPPFHAAT